MKYAIAMIALVICATIARLSHGDERDLQHQPTLIDLHFVERINTGDDSLRLYLEKQPRRSSDWADALGSIRDGRGYYAAFDKLKKKWKLLLEEDVYVPADYALENRDEEMLLKNVNSGKTISLSPIAATLSDKKSLFSKRICAELTEEWTAIAFCRDAPSDVEVRYWKNSDAKTIRSYKSTCLQADELMGRHSQVFQLDISDGLLSICTASTTGMTFDVVRLETGKSKFHLCVPTGRE